MHLYETGIAIYFCEVYLDEQTFSESLLVSGVALLNWFTKSSRFEEVFNENELL